MTYSANLLKLKYFMVEEVSSDLTKLVFQDELTELYNRRYLHQHLNNQIDWKSTDASLSPTTLLMIDVDFFKDINDTYGHLAGDNALKHLAKIIKENISKTDIAIRYAGDEFTVIMPGTNKIKGHSQAEALRQKVAQTTFPTKDKELKLNICIGIATFPADAKSPEELIDAADKALYFSKRRGKNRVSISGEEDKAVTAERDVLKNFPPPIFIGRETIWTELEHTLKDVKDENNTFVLIEGEMGSGKTRLLNELNKSFENEVSCFLFTCLESESNMPYRPLIKLLSNLIPTAPAIIEKTYKSLSYHQRTELRKLLPNLPSLSEPNPAGSEIADEERRKFIFDGLTSIINDLSENRPLLILLDEMHNLDEGTLQIINYFNGADHGKLMVCGVIPSFILNVIESKCPQIDTFLGEVAETQGFRHIPLPLFDYATTTKFISALLVNRPENTVFDQKLFELTHGNPLFIEETIKNLIMKKYIVQQDETWIINPISDNVWPSTIESIIHDNFMLLDKTTAELVNQAAVAGVQIDLNVLRNLVGKNEGEVLDLLDKAKKSRFIEEKTPGQIEQFGFISQRVREITYEQIDTTTKQKLHHDVARATEQIYKNNLDQVAPTLSFHLNQAGDKEAAAKYTSQVQAAASQVFRSEEVSRYYEHGKMIIRSRIKEAGEPLSENLMKIMRDVLRGLCATAKNMRLYPEGSQLISHATTGLLKSLETVFNQADKITISEIKNALHINTVTADPKLFGASATEFLTLLKDHYIKSYTLRKGVTEKEIETLLKDLDNSPDKNYSTPGYWNKFLEEHNISNIGIAQRAFMATATKVSSKISALRMASKIELTTETVPLVRDTLRYLTAALENIKLYPSGSQLTTRALEQLQQALATLFNHVDTVEFGEVEDNLLLNGVLLHPRIFGLATQNMAKTIKENKIKSITINRATSSDELDKVLHLLNNPPRGTETSLEDWHNAITEQGIINISIGEAAYSIADVKKGSWRKGTSGVTGDTFGANMPEDENTANQGKIEPNLLEQTINLLKSMPDKLVSAEFIELTNKLAQSNIIKQLIDLIDRFIDNFKSDRPEIRSKALTFYAHSFSKMSEHVKEYLVNHAVPVLLQHIKSNKSVANHVALLDAVYHTVLFNITKKDYETSASLVSALGRESKNFTYLTDELKQERWKTIEKITRDERFAETIKDLQNPDTTIQSSVLIFLSAFEDIMLPTLLEQIKTSDQTGQHEAIATLINQAGPSAITSFVNELKSITDVESLKRLINILTIVSPPEINSLLANLLKHRNETVREEALKVIKKLPKDTSLPILVATLDEIESIALLAASTLTELGYHEATDKIISLFNKVTDKVRICHLLGKLADVKAVPFLKNVLFKSGFLGFGRYYSDEIRGAAAWSLGKIKTPEAVAVLEKALKDKSPQVRSAAKLGLTK